MSTVVVPELKGLRFSGHESFACRYAWLPKACRALADNPRLFTDEDDAMVKLGLGKNMVRSLRFWVDAMGLVKISDRGRHMELNDFAEAIFGEGGLDPYLEDETTLWLLHWNLSSKTSGPIFAWDFLISRWPRPEFTRSEALAAFRVESDAMGGEHSDVTLAQHLDVFLHTYLPGRAAANMGAEDSLDGPLVELSLLQPIGERRQEAGRWEPVYGFRREAKPEISQALFDYCLLDFARRREASDRTLTFRTVAVLPGSPGQVFKLPEGDVRARLEEVRPEGRAGFSYQSSSVQGQVVLSESNAGPTLQDVYEASR
ncbi:DUF4007 family protein [Brevundimonas sp. FT23042]|uniref:DUF4007 family protein n=1 Tax=Brevundimonas sp. FT23042 TaxID=3393749 RepID=UPI003B586E5B